MATIDSETLRKISICCIKEHLLETSKNASRHMMSDEQIIGIGRRSCWLLDYWANGYRGSCTYEDPCATYGGKSYYGWKMSEDNENECVPTNDVSEEIRDLSLKYNLNTYEKPTNEVVNLLSTSSDVELFDVEKTEDDHDDIFNWNEGGTSVEMQRNEDLLKRLCSDETGDVENKVDDVEDIEILTGKDRKHKHRHRRRHSRKGSHTSGHRHRHRSERDGNSTTTLEISDVNAGRRLGKEPDDKTGFDSDEDDLESIFVKLVKRGAENAPELDKSEGRIKKKQKTIIL
jgi:hypothetical protein